MAVTVNEILGDLQRFDGQPVEVTGLFSFALENVCLEHWPRGERLRHLDEPTIWLSPAHGPFDFDVAVLERLAGRRVLVTGDLHIASDPAFGFGHGGLWPVEIRVSDMRRL